MVEASTLYTWDYQFQLPGNLARILSLTYEGYKVQFERLGNVIHTLRTPVDLMYVKSFSGTTDNTAFPPDFAEVLSNLLAAEICVSMTQNQSLRDTYLNMYAERLRQCRFNGAVEQPTQYIDASSWLDSRVYPLSVEIDPSQRGLQGY